MPTLVDACFPEAERIRVMLDNVNTHTPAAPYEAFAPAEARRILPKLEFHYPPKRGNRALGVGASSPVLAPAPAGSGDAGAGGEGLGRVADADQARVEWRFTMADARTKLKRLYPSQA